MGRPFDLVPKHSGFAAQKSSINGHHVTTVVIKDNIKETHCTISYLRYYKISVVRAAQTNEATNKRSGFRKVPAANIDRPTDRLVQLNGFHQYADANVNIMPYNTP